MSAKSGKAFFMACGQRDAQLALPMDEQSKFLGTWPEWAKHAYFIAYNSTRIAGKGK